MPLLQLASLSFAICYTEHTYYIQTQWRTAIVFAHTRIYIRRDKRAPHTHTRIKSIIRLTRLQSQKTWTYTQTHSSCSVAECASYNSRFPTPSMHTFTFAYTFHTDAAERTTRSVAQSDAPARAQLSTPPNYHTENALTNAQHKHTNKADEWPSICTHWCVGCVRGTTSRILAAEERSYHECICVHVHYCHGHAWTLMKVRASVCAWVGWRCAYNLAHVCMWKWNESTEGASTHLYCVCEKLWLLLSQRVSNFSYEFASDTQWVIAQTEGARESFRCVLKDFHAIRLFVHTENRLLRVCLHSIHISVLFGLSTLPIYLMPELFGRRFHDF